MMFQRNCAQLTTATSVLFDVFGCQSAAQASFWLLQMQSRIASSWMIQTLKDAINPVSEIATSLKRLDELERKQNPSENSQRQVAAEITFLNNTSTPWKRYVFSH